MTSIREGDQVSGIEVFLSYSHRDEHLLQMISPFKLSLEGFVSALGGPEISTFLDRESINWGADWRADIERSLLKASVFIPLISANYFKSENCRDELTKFHAAAQRLQVNELLLPVTLYPADTLHDMENDDPLVATALKYQYADISEAVMAGEGTQTWRTQIRTLAEKFNRAYRDSELRLAEPLIEEPRTTSNTDDSPREKETPGFIELIEKFQKGSSQVVDSMTKMEGPIYNLGDISQTATNEITSGDVSKLKVWSIRTAQRFEDPSTRIEELGSQTLSAVTQMDESLSGLYQLANDVEVYREPLQAAIETFEGVEGTRDQLVKMMESMKVPESTSAAIRRALRPARTGLTRVNDALSIMEGWKEGKL